MLASEIHRPAAGETTAIHYLVGSTSSKTAGSCLCWMIWLPFTVLDTSLTGWLAHSPAPGRALVSVLT